MDDPVFRSGAYDISYVERVGLPLLEAAPDERALRHAALAAALAEHELRQAAVALGAPERDASASAWLRDARQRALR
jgi:hypothetical protein